VHRRGPFVRLLTGLVLGCGAFLILTGGLALRGSGVIAVGAAGVLAACLAAGMAREHPDRDRWAMVEAAVLAVGGTVGGLLVICGLAVLFGSGPTVALTAFAAIGGVGFWLLRTQRAAHRIADQPAPASAASRSPLAEWLAAGAPAAHRVEPLVAETGRLLPPVDQLSTRALGREWLRTTAALAGRLEPVVGAALVRRREDTLDELERRDPVGFARWLAAGPEPGSDPADWLHSDSAGSPEAA
jgi:hypothetical protein